MSSKSARLVFQQALSNGLAMELWDHSRLITGGRWFVSLETRIAIPVQAEALPPDLEPLARDVLATLGPEVLFSQKDERNFIAAAEMPALLQEMQDRVLQLAPVYFGHADFAARFIRKVYAARQAQPRRQGAGT
jgi:hypothetical protein